MDCCICLENATIPTTGENCLPGHVFCKRCIQRWLREKDECPVCRLPMYSEMDTARRSVVEGSQIDIDFSSLLSTVSSHPTADEEPTRDEGVGHTVRSVFYETLIEFCWL
jgi:hypothetical protein